MLPSSKFKSANPTILVIFGATGDLTARKLAPALFRLYAKKLLPPFFQIVGFSRRKINNGDFQKEISTILKKQRFSAKGASEFSNLFLYTQGFFEKKKGYEELARILGRKDQEWRTCANKIFYLAVPPQYYNPILKNLAASGLTEPCSPEEGYTRVVVEKPFGSNLKTAEELDELLGKLFKEEQIYRIDHYLGKETVQNILAFRFSNSFWEGIWNKDYIEEIKVRLWEKGGVEGRADFYDKIGALRDVGQNHLLQLLALMTMDNPEDFSAASVRQKRAEVLGSLKILKPEEISGSTFRGQYQSYRKAGGIPKNSQTETYFRIKASLENSRWRGLPIILESGKKLSQSKAEVTVVFKHQTPCLCPPGRHLKNVLSYEVQPREKISASFWVKRPGTQMILEEKDFSFDYQKVYPKSVFVDAYEKLLLDVFNGNQTLFVGTAEIKASWKFIDAIESGWKKQRLLIYPVGSNPSKFLPKTAIAAGRSQKEIGFIGFGKMGRNMSLRLLGRNWRVKAFDKENKAIVEWKDAGIVQAKSIADLIRRIKRPRLIWLMLPAGEAVEEAIFGRKGLARFLNKRDIIIDGGNSFYEETMKRAQRLKKLGIDFLDVGVSGGPAGARNGASLMVGGEREVFEKLGNLFSDLAVSDGYQYVGKAGAGHFVKMVHNGIEYGMMQALAEGFAILKKSPFRLDLEKIAEVYNHGSVIESRLVNWLREAFKEYGENLEEVSGSVKHTGEGEWTVKTAKKLAVSAKVIEEAFRFRIESGRKPSYEGKILSALRNQFGGHSLK